MSTPDISAKLAEALAVLQGSATYYSCHHEDALAERAAAAAQNIRELLAAPSASPAADWQRRLQTALTAPGCERLREWYGIGPVQRAAVEEFLVTALSASPAEAPAEPWANKAIPRMSVDEMAAMLYPQPVAPAGQVTTRIWGALQPAGQAAAGVQGEVQPNDDEVICPACCHQFRAIPVSVQRLMLAAGFEPPFTTAPAVERGVADLLRQARRFLDDPRLFVSEVDGRRRFETVQEHLDRIIATVQQNEDLRTLKAEIDAALSPAGKEQA